jgi:hypothetical protein
MLENYRVASRVVLSSMELVSSAFLQESGDQQAKLHGKKQ